MGFGFYFSVSLLPVMIILSTIYFLKNRVKNQETKIYNYILITSVIMTISEIVSAMVYKSLFGTIGYDLIAKLVFLSYMAMAILFCYYLMTICNRPKISTTIMFVFSIVSAILVVITPTIFIENNDIIAPSGMPVIVTFGHAILLGTYQLLLVIINRKKISAMKFSPFYLFLVFGAINLFISYIFPTSFMVGYLWCLTVMIMYFTIENPDVKMLDELAKNKKIIENQNEDTTNFLFRITQDIKKPILDLLEESKGRDMIDARYINNKMRELDFTVNDVLDVSGMSTRRIKLYDNNYDIHNLMKEIKIKTESELPKEIKMEYNISRNVPKMLYGDYIMLKKVVLSMIDNAIKHTKEGYISLDVDAIVKYDVARVIISVSDTGVGMDLGMINDILSHEISDEQYQLDNEKGILNLRDIKHIMPSLDGTFVIKSERDLGTTVSITVNEKIVNTEEREIVKKIEMYEESLNSGKKIMVVDDDAIELSKIKKIIENKGNSCNTSLFGKDVVEKVSKGHKYDLIMLDDETDTHSAYEIYGQLKKIKGFDIPVIIMIEDDKEFIKLHFLKEGFSDVILKSKLNDEVLRVLDRKY